MGSITLRVVAAERTELPELQDALAAHVREKALNGPFGKLLLGLGRGPQRP
jgi:hypothetical protein